jgi:hypothetical protein
MTQATITPTDAVPAKKKPGPKPKTVAEKRAAMTSGAVPSPVQYDINDRLAIPPQVQEWANQNGLILGWKRYLIEGTEDVQNLSTASLQGWSPVLKSDLPDGVTIEAYSNNFASVMPDRKINTPHICVGDSILVKIELERYEQLRRIPVSMAERAHRDDEERMRNIQRELGDAVTNESKYTKA